ncbi:CRE-SGT-1 protein [Caenorhabditis remanei]|uniref:CRE-SGT-1 protein n=1 Tax=Caenorhabditis remanei TaxID=31234 RepID=E3M494_CAERE|nr:CRE-SGT-1 protein [Caenorhabditis remanei]
MAEETKPSAPEAPTNAPIVTTDEQNLVVSFLQFIRQKVSQNQVTSEQAEALEVAIQCLEHSFALNDASYAFQPSRPILELFKSAEGLPDGESALPTPSDADISQANKLKEEGNDLMKASQFDAAVQKYNAAIKLNRDPVYFCNRAAAYCRLEQYDLAIQDCRTALALDPTYSKAWGRMGLAYSCQNRYEHAAEAYKKALELEPHQESYKNNLKIAEDKLKELESSRPAQAANPLAGLFGAMGGGGPGLGGMPGMPNMGNLLNEPGLMQAASQMMNDPGLADMFNNMMSGQGSIADLMAAGQQMAARMQETNPELIENLRRQFGPGGEGGAPPPAPPQ